MAGLVFPNVFSPFIAAVLLWAAGMLVSILAFKSPTWSRRLSLVFSVLASVSAMAAGVWAMLGGAMDGLVVARMAGVGSFSFGVDALSGFFVFLIGLVGLASSWYSFSYLEAFERRRYSLPRFCFLFNGFLLSMLLVVTAQNALAFLVFWELMALSSFFLVAYEHRDPIAADASFSYLLITHLGTAALIFMFLILITGAGSLDFSAFSSAAFPSVFKDAIFLLALLGFGSKAGIMPLHIWLPKAHPQAPGNVSALMSAVMVKTAIYGFVRVCFGFLKVANGAAAWWGEALLALGVLSAVLGALYALAENDLKRLLAFSTIENVGLLFMGLGVSVLFFSAHLVALGSLALLATLVHALNHAAFKGLLFLGSGSVAHEAHSKNLNALGGLIKKMPLTAILFFVGAAAMAALPPLNGFAGEWLMFQSFLGGAVVSSRLILFSCAAAVLALALAGALALATSVKAFGVSFLGLPRSEQAEKAQEPGSSQIVGMGFLAASCVLLGAFPFWASSGFGLIFQSLGIAGASTALFALAQTPTSFLFVLLSAGLLGASGVLSVLGQKKAKERRPTWDCGIAQVTPSMQYSGTGVSMPVLRAFSRFLDPLKKAEASGCRFFEQVFYQPILQAFLSVAPLSRKLQTGRLYHYLAYLMLTLLGVVVWALV